MAPSSSLGCLGGVAAVTVAASGILEQVGRAILFILDRRVITCLECDKEKQPEKMKKHVDKHRARDAEKSEAEKAALKAECDRKLAELQLKTEEQMRKEREDMRIHLISVLEYKARCDRDWFEQAKAKDQKKNLEGSELISNEEERGKGRRRGSRVHTH